MQVAWCQIKKIGPEEGGEENSQKSDLDHFGPSGYGVKICLRPKAGLSDVCVGVCLIQKIHFVTFFVSVQKPFVPL